MSEEKLIIEKEPISLGSGDIYIEEYAGGELPALSVLEVDEKKAGHVKDGANLAVTETFYVAKSDDDKAVRKKMIGDDYKLNYSDIITNAETIKRALSTVNVIDDAERGVQRLEMGGISNYKSKRYLVLFVNDDKDTRILVMGSNESGLNLSFLKDKETVNSFSFSAEPLPNGRKAIIEFGKSKATPTPVSEVVNEK